MFGMPVYPHADGFPVWSNTLCRDTVCSVGLSPHHLPFTCSNTAIRYFRHAISLDERRAKFKANHWHLLHDADQLGTKLGEMPRSNQRHPYYHNSHRQSHAEEENDGQTKTDVQEVWFAGCHCGACNHRDSRQYFQFYIIL